MTQPSKLTKLNVLLLCGSLFMGILFDYLFYDVTIGVSYLVFWIVFYVFFYLIFKEKIHFEKNFEWFLTSLILLLMATFVLFSNDDFNILNVLIIPLLVIVQTILLTKNNKHPWYKLSFLGETFNITMESVVNILVPFQMIREWIRSKSNKSAYGVIGKVMIGIIFSLPLIGIIIVLLTSADLIFSHWINEIPSFFWKIDFGDIPFQIFLILFVSFVIFTFLWSLKYPLEVIKLPSLETEKKSFQIDGIITLTILLLVNLVYLLFTAIQVSYLFGAAKQLLPTGVTYAEYATQGFNQLVIVTILNIFIVILVIYLVQKSQPLIYRTVQVLLSLLTACTAFILVSAFQKLSLYVEVYGYTYTRILVHAFMILLLSFFVVALVKTWKNKISLVKIFSIIFLLWYVTLNYISIDQIIAKQNIKRYFLTKQTLPTTTYDDRYGYSEYVDISYLNQLSYEAVPQLIKLRSEPKLKPIIDYNLKLRKQQLDNEKDWQSFNLSKYRAKQLLEKIY
jgi:hypothetical protein